MGDPQRGIRKYQWKPGESGNKRGRPRGGLSLLEQLNLLTAEVKSGVGKHTVEKLQAIADSPPDSKVSYARRAASVQLLECLKPGRYGTVAYYRLLDRLLGYPRQSLGIDGNIGVQQKRVVVVEDFEAHTLLDQSGRSIIMAHDGTDVIEADELPESYCQMLWMVA